MSIITQILATLVALEFFYILCLETFATTSDKTSAFFGMEASQVILKYFYARWTCYTYTDFYNHLTLTIF